MNGKRPIIAISPLWDEEKKSMWMLPGYFGGLEQAGATPIMLPLTDNEEELRQLADLADGFLIPGGQDVNPALYGEEAQEQTIEISPIKDSAEQTFLTFMLQQDKPVLGICRGIQLLNVTYGGTLYQDLPNEIHQKHHMDPPYNMFWHMVNLIPDTPIAEIIGRDTLEVNSIHHQAIHEVAPSMKVMAVTEQNVVEGIYDPNHKFVLGIQWHPEYLYERDKGSRKIFQAFVNACQN